MKIVVTVGQNSKEMLTHSHLLTESIQKCPQYRSPHSAVETPFMKLYGLCKLYVFSGRCN